MLAHFATPLALTAFQSSRLSFLLLKPIKLMNMPPPFSINKHIRKLEAAFWTPSETVMCTVSVMVTLTLKQAGVSCLSTAEATIYDL